MSELSRKALEAKVRAIFGITAPRRYRLKTEHLVEVELDPIGMGHTFLGDIDVSNATQGIKVESMVGDITKITITMIAMPVKVRALGMVEIIEAHPELRDIDG